jgi:hypothetical protein
MKTIWTLLTGLPLALLLPAVTQGQVADSLPVKGKVLVLVNEGTLEGDVERLGTQYRVRRPVGETWIQGARVLRLCASLEDAYLFLRSRANLQDPDEHLRLAEWCRERGLREPALAEVKVALELRPDHPRSQRFLMALEQSPATVTTKPVEESSCPLADVNSESLNAFATRVQPILMNACASCHANGKGGAFKLVRSFEAEIGNRRHTQQNLTAVLAEVNLGQPQSSPFLIKSQTLHASGMDQPPLTRQQVVAYKTLEDWVVKTLASNPHLREQAGALAATLPGAPASTGPAFAESRTPEALPQPAPSAVRTLPEPDLLRGPMPTTSAAGRGEPLPPIHPSGAPTAQPTATPVPTQGAGKRTDPDEFNRQAHPDRR